MRDENDPRPTQDRMHLLRDGPQPTPTVTPCDGDAYIWGVPGPNGYDTTGFTELTDWNAWVHRDRVGVIRALLEIELRYRGRLLRARVERALVRLMSR